MSLRYIRSTAFRDEKDTFRQDRLGTQTEEVTGHRTERRGPSTQEPGRRARGRVTASTKLYRMRYGCNKSELKHLKKNPFALPAGRAPKRESETARTRAWRGAGAMAGSPRREIPKHHLLLQQITHTHTLDRPF